MAREVKLRSVDGVPYDKHAPAPAKPDPRVEFLKARTAHLVELNRKLDLVGKQIEEMAAKAKRR